MLRRTLLHSCVLLVGLAAACSDDPCDEDVLQDLANRCSLQLGAVSGAACIASNEDGRLELQRQICEVKPPDVDVDCLRNEPCEQIESGACANSTSTGGSNFDCVVSCQTAAFDCDLDCGTTDGFDQCSDCVVDCQETFVECTDACG